MEQLLAWVKKLAVFMILCSYMEHLIPSHYKRYFHMCTGLILILMISTPLLRIVHGDMESEVICLLENLRTSSKGYQTDSTLEQEYRDYYMSQYKSAVTEQIEAQARSEGLCAEKITFSVDEDPESSSYGLPDRFGVNGDKRKWQAGREQCRHSSEKKYQSANGHTGKPHSLVGQSDTAR